MKRLFLSLYCALALAMSSPVASAQSAEPSLINREEAKACKWDGEPGTLPPPDWQYNCCQKSIKLVLKQLAYVESEKSPGQIEACVPAKDPAQNTAAIQRKLKKNSETLTALWAKYGDLSNRVSTVVNSEEVKACSASPELMSRIKALTEEDKTIEDKIQINLNSVREQERAFDRQYPYIWSETADQLAKKPNCVRTERYWDVLNWSFINMGANCTGLGAKLGDAFGSLIDLDLDLTSMNSRCHSSE